MQEARPSTGKLLRRSETGFSVRLLPSPLTRELTQPPPIGEYVLVRPKDTARVLIEIADEKALLTTWRFGTGRSAAFAAPAGCFVDWDDAGALWANIIDWAARRPGDESLTATVTVDRGMATVEVADPSGEPKDYRAVAVNPSGEAVTLHLQQVAPDLYEGRFAADAPGVYPVSILDFSAGGALRARAAAVVSYSPEWARLGSNLPLLSEISKATGGAVLQSMTELPAPENNNAQAFANISWLPALAALLLFLIELAIP